MVRIVDPVRFWGGLIVVIISALLGSIISQLAILWLFVIVGLAFMVDAVTARECPNGHLTYMWSRVYGTNSQYCPKCGEPFGQKQMIRPGTG